MTILSKVDKYINDKLDKNENYIECKVYDLRINYDLLEDELEEFLEYAKIRLENLGFEVYFTGAKYVYKNKAKEVEYNKYFVAVKE